MSKTNEFSLWGAVDAALVKPREKKPITSWHASGFGSCPTGRYLERLGVAPDEEFDERTLRVFSAGSKFEEWLLDLAAGSLPELVEMQRQVRIELPDWNVTGYADAMVTIQLEQPETIRFKGGEETVFKKMLIYEIKSKHSQAFHWMRKLGEGAMRQHQMQVWLYMHALKIEEARVLYVSKDDLSFAEYPVFHQDVKLGEEVALEAALLNRAWAEKLPPKPIADEKAWQNRYCRWHKSCVSQPKYLEP
jgi:hypothetical protein